ncbi:MAG: glycosyltransferase [Candidatus Pacebacteria bacterium]|nr:glycosyltransferase [Candidatus Paceibacterota bacterium]
MKIAIAHDTLVEFGGAERVLFSLVKLFPKADIYISLASEELLNKLKKNTQGQIKISFFSYLPFKERYASWLKPLINLYWFSLDMKKYDLVISSSHSFNSKAINTSIKTKHISYIHTPPRFLYGYFNKTKLVSHPILKFFFLPLMWLMKSIDFKSAQKANVLITNSKETQNRIRNHYHRKSLVIYPPVRQVNNFKKNINEYYVCLSQLYKQKGIHLAIEACNELQKKLIVIGAGPEEKRLRRIAGPTIEFKGFIKDAEVTKILNKAKAILYPSIEEDFGLSPVEALAHGVPIIAYKSGATPEYVIPNITGLLFNEYSVKSLKKAILKFENKKWSSHKCYKFSQKFSEDKFHQQILELIDKKYT